MFVPDTMKAVYGKQYLIFDVFFCIAIRKKKPSDINMSVYISLFTQHYWPSRHRLGIWPHWMARASVWRSTWPRGAAGTCLQRRPPRSASGTRGSRDHVSSPGPWRGLCTRAWWWTPRRSPRTWWPPPSCPCSCPRSDVCSGICADGKSQLISNFSSYRPDRKIVSISRSHFELPVSPYYCESRDTSPPAWRKLNYFRAI